MSAIANASTSFKLSMRPDGRTADVTVTFRGATNVVLHGIVVEEQRAGWLCMRLPPEDAWSAALRAMPETTRAQVHDADFYERLRTAVGKKFLEMRATLT